MLKRTIPLLIAVAVVLSVAAPARANHCARCMFSVDEQWCKFNAVIGGADCYVDQFGVCHQTGSCTHLSAAVTPLFAEFEVASVERIDEAPASDQTLVAQLDAPQPAAEATH